MSSHTTAEQQAIWHAKNPGKRREYKATEYAKHKEAIVERVAIWRKQNPEKDRQMRARYREKHREDRIAAGKIYREKNKLQIKEYSRLRYIRDPEKIKSSHHIWKTKNPEKYKQVRKSDRVNTMRRYRSEINFRLAAIIRNRIKHFITNGNGKRRCKSLILLGTGMVEVRTHLESQFKPGMTWETQGCKGWHIDHIVPISSFDLTNPEQQRRCFHYTNLQPLWWWENLAKSDQIL